MTLSKCTVVLAVLLTTGAASSSPVAPCPALFDEIDRLLDEEPPLSYKALAEVDSLRMRAREWYHRGRPVEGTRALLRAVDLLREHSR